MPAGWRWRRTSRPSWRSTYPAARSWWGTARSAPPCRPFPTTHFTGRLENGGLAAYAGADVFVFPSRTDTFGLVLLEALAAGTPVAASPVTGALDVVGPLDVIGPTPEPVGALSTDLGAACRRYAEGWSWAVCAARFRETLVPVGA
ncbi:MAG: alpha-mannosyltransferase [Roseomonas sp.]|nr:alpha-mannosyltransferase [Roseomonas sp.]